MYIKMKLMGDGFFIWLLTVLMQMKQHLMVDNWFWLTRGFQVKCKERFLQERCFNASLAAMVIADDY